METGWYLSQENCGNERIIYVSNYNYKIYFPHNVTYEPLNTNRDNVRKVDFEDIKYEVKEDFVKILKLKQDLDLNESLAVSILKDTENYKHLYEDPITEVPEGIIKWSNYVGVSIAKMKDVIFYDDTLSMRYNTNILKSRYENKQIYNILHLPSIILGKKLDRIIKHIIHNKVGFEPITDILYYKSWMDFSKGNFCELVVEDNKPLIRFLPKDKPIKFRNDGSLYYTQTISVGRFIKDLLRKTSVSEDLLRKFSETIISEIETYRVEKYEGEISDYMTNSVFEKEWSTSSCMVGKDKERFRIYDYLQERNFIEMYVVKNQNGEIKGRFFKWLNVNVISGIEQDKIDFFEKVYYEKESVWLFIKDWFTENNANHKQYNQCNEEKDFSVWENGTRKHLELDLAIYIDDDLVSYFTGEEYCFNDFDDMDEFLEEKYMEEFMLYLDTMNRFTSDGFKNYESPNCWILKRC